MYYLEWLNFFGLPAETNLDCGSQPAWFPSGGSSDVDMYFDKDWSVAGRCKVVNWFTQYSSAARDDYKRCVCDLWGSGAQDCPTGDFDTSNQERGDGTVDPDPVDPDPVDPDPVDPVEPEVVYKFSNLCRKKQDQS